jgi:hypothetical protein
MILSVHLFDGWLGAKIIVSHNLVLFDLPVARLVSSSTYRRLISSGWSWDQLPGRA